MGAEAVVGGEGERLEAAAAKAGGICRAAGNLAAAVGVLMDAVIGRGQLEPWCDRVTHAGPVNLHQLGVVVGSVVDECQNVSTDGVEPGVQRRLWILVLDVLVASKEFEPLELVQCHKGICRVVRDRCRERIRYRITELWKLADLSGGQGGRRDGTVDLGIVRIDRYARGLKSNVRL